MAPKRKMTGNGHPSKRVKTSKKTWRKKSSGEELKFFDTALSFTCDATGEVPATGQLALIPQGILNQLVMVARQQSRVYGSVDNLILYFIYCSDSCRSCVHKCCSG